MSEKIEFTYKDRLNLKNVLCMVLLRGTNTEGTPIFAYVSMLGHRMEEFHRAYRNGGVNLKDYNASVILTGEGEPTDEHRLFMLEKYLFSPDKMNVRIFP